MKLIGTGLAAVARSSPGQGSPRRRTSVKMLNKGADGAMVFEPSFVQAQPGDTVHFVAVDKRPRCREREGCFPDGVRPFRARSAKISTCR